MKNKELFDRTISILVKAYFENTLQHQYCACCVVGNLVAYGMNLTSIVNSNEFAEGVYAVWESAIQQGEVYEHNYTGRAKIQIDSTGYSLFELAEIEKAFEKSRNTFGGVFSLKETNSALQFHSLMAVCDALMQIHEANEIEIQQAKSLFTKELAV